MTPQAASITAAIDPRSADCCSEPGHGEAEPHGCREQRRDLLGGQTSVQDGIGAVERLIILERTPELLGGVGGFGLALPAYTLRAWASREGFRVELTETSLGEGRVGSLRLARPSSVELIERGRRRDDMRSAGWSLEPHSSWEEDLFVQLTAPAHNRVARATPEQSRTILRLSDAVMQVCEAAVARCDSMARQAALMFEPMERLAAYERFAADTTRRLAQAALLAPGALCLLFTLERAGAVDARDAAKRMCEGIVAGRSLKALLDDALEIWLARSWFPHTERVPGSAAWVEARKRRRLQLWRAPGGLSTRLLANLPPLAIPPDEIPVDHEERKRWYRLMLRVCNPRHGVGSSAFVDLATLASKHFAALESHPASEHIVRDAMDSVAYRGRVPARELSFSNWLEDLRAFRQECSLRQQLERQANSTSGQLMQPLELLLRRGGPLDGHTPPAGLTCKALRTSAELRAESRRMRNCVANYIAESRAGASAIYHLEAGEEPLTLGFSLTARGWRPFDFGGISNRSPSSSARMLVGSWLQTLGLPAPPR